MRIRGELTFDGAAADLSGAAVCVRVMDASRADAAATAVAETTIAALPRATTTAGAIAFELDVAQPDARQRYILWARVDVDRDGRTSRGDYITMQEYPLQAGGPSQHYRLALRRVG